MELPAEVLIHNALLGLKGAPGTLLQIAPEGYYLVTCRFGDREHRVMLPVGDTVIIAKEHEEPAAEILDVER